MLGSSVAESKARSFSGVRINLQIYYSHGLLNDFSDDGCIELGNVFSNKKCPVGVE